MSALEILENFEGPGALYLQRAQGRRRGAPVLITHGTFSSHETLQPLANFLSREGKDVYVIEWRGRDQRPGTFDFFDLAEGEMRAALAAIPEPSHLVAHSGGGLAMCFALLDDTSRQKVKSLTLIATQGTHLTEAPLLPYLAIRALGGACRIPGYWPTRLIGLGPCNETSALLSQWISFNARKRIETPDGRDLLEQLGALNLPCLGLAGAADLIIARPDGCKALTDAFGRGAKFHLCSAESDGEDFTHTRLIRSRSAQNSVWPRILNFQRSHDGHEPLSPVR